MKDQFLKIAKVKNLKEFYKKFPTEEAFMAKHGKEVKKLIGGGDVGQLAGKLGELAKSNAFGTAVQGLGDVIHGFQLNKDQRNELKTAEQWKGVSDVALQASLTRPEQVKRRYVRPEDNINTGEEFFPIYGAGTVLAKKGTDIPKAQFGNQNFMKAPKNPNKETSDIYKFASDGGMDALSQLTAGIGNPKGYGQSGSAKVAGGIAGVAGTLLGGPVGGMLAKTVVGAIANGIDTKPERTQEFNDQIAKNMGLMALNQGAKSLQQQNVSYMRTGGNLRNNQMAMGGDLKTHWGGRPETISYNPFLPDGGETVMFKGNMHSESDGKGNTGIGVTYGNSPVEVEHGEPAVQLKNGGDTSLTVFGNLKIPKYGVEMLGDPKAKGKKFKSYIADLSKKEEKYNKLIDKSAEGLEELDVKTPFDKIKFDSYKANITGGTMQQKEIAEKKMKAANLQDAINSTAEEMGVDADALAKGKIKKAKAGANVDKAQMGRSSIDRRGVRTPANIPPQQPRTMSGLTLPEAVIEANQYGIPLEEFVMEGERMSPISDVVPKLKPYGQWGLGTNFSDLIDAAAKEQEFQNRWSVDSSTKPFDKWGLRQNPMEMSQEEAFQDRWSIDPFTAKPFDKWGLRGKGPFDIQYEDVTEEETPAKGTSSGKGKGTGKSTAQKRKEEAEKNQALMDLEIAKRELPEISFDTPGIQPRPEQTVEGQVGEEEGFDWMNIANQIIPYVRPTNARPLNPRQLAGEMYALSTNQVEPVRAQTFQPELSTPYDISLQDIMNKNESDYRAAQRMTGYNPAAQAMLNAQKYKANQEVLGEQFRMNQAMRDKVFAENRNLLNDAKLRNLGILDQQYVRQQEALSKTKATTQAALNSISAKYAQNELENRTLQTYENLYNYRFDPRMRAINMNQLAQFDTDMYVPVTDSEGKIVEYKVREKQDYSPTGVPGKRSVTSETKTKSQNGKNGSIVKAFKS